ncbi:acyl-CoA-binding protein [Jejudonia soesokkakensis]|uniref:Acyl-CoA-binding protein n=1 Tax=Jejudonia soesokkakensis TaxID=1323432 RepID=A0ABW2MTS5_9FLAO
MNDADLNSAFEKAVHQINEHSDAFPADVLLKLYAYYKRATNSSDISESGKPLISAFKTNALFQTKGLSQNEAKKLYIETVTHYFLYRK